jgi:hypothetical protein
MKIGIVHLYTENYKSMAEITLPGKEQYAKKYGYTVFNKDDNFVPDVHIGRQKCYFIVELMDQNPDIEWFWHSGTDCLITNHNIKLENLIDTNTDIHFIVCKDDEGINADVFFIRNSSEGREYMKHLTEPHASGTEQGWMWDDEHNPKWRNITKYIPQNKMNSYDLKFYPHKCGFDLFNERSNWQLGDFLLQAITGYLPGAAVGSQKLYDWKLNILRSHIDDVI